MTPARPRPWPLGRRWRLRRPGRRVLAQELLLVGATLIVLLPSLFVVFTALKSQSEYALDKIGPPDPLTFENIETAMRGGRFGLWLTNSIILTASSVLLALVVSAPAAFAFARMRFRADRKSVV